MAAGKTKSLPFNWDKFFVPSETECLLACFAMSARYWGSFFPDLNLPVDLEVWKEFAQASFVSYRGTSIREMMRRAPTKSPEQSESIASEEDVSQEAISSKTNQLLELVIKTSTPSRLDQLTPFFKTRPPIPQILAFDRLLMTHNVSGGTGHAIILQQIDFQKEKLFVIDSTKTHMQEPDVYDFRLFKKAWSAYQNLQIITYPKELITMVSGPTAGIVRQQDISTYFGGKK